MLLCLLCWHKLDPPHALHLLRSRLCSQRLTPPQSLHLLGWRPCAQMPAPPHSLHLRRSRPCSQMLAPPQSLHLLRWRLWGHRLRSALRFLRLAAPPLACALARSRSAAALAASQNPSCSWARSAPSADGTAAAILSPTPRSPATKPPGGAPEFFWFSLAVVKICSTKSLPLLALRQSGLASPRGRALPRRVEGRAQARVRRAGPRAGQSDCAPEDANARPDARPAGAGLATGCPRLAARGHRGAGSHGTGQFLPPTSQ